MASIRQGAHKFMDFKTGVPGVFVFWVLYVALLWARLRAVLIARTEALRDRTWQSPAAEGQTSNEHKQNVPRGHEDRQTTENTSPRKERQPFGIADSKLYVAQ